MKVLFLNPLGALGGSERSLLDVLDSLGRHAPSVTRGLLVMAAGELVERAGELGVEAFCEPLPPRLAALGESEKGARPAQRGLEILRATSRLPGYLSLVRRRVRDFSPDLLHTNGMKAHLLAALGLRSLPLVVHLRDFPSSRPISRHLLRLLPRDRTLVVTNSRAVEQEVRAIAPGLRTRAVLNAIDTTEFAPGAGELAELARLAGLDPLPASALGVGMVATYAHWKGHLTFLDAAARLAQRPALPPLVFLIVGGAIYGTAGSELSEAELRREIAGRGLERSVGLVPFQSDIARVYRALDVVVHASTRPEPFGRTVVEAMATGRAVVVSRAGGVLELFEEGRSALGFTPGDAAELAAAVERLAGDAELRRALGDEARRQAVERFDRRRLGPELETVYRELLRGRA